MYEQDEYNVVDPEVAFSRTLVGKECQICKRILHYKFFDKDSSSRDGYALICPKCKATPRLSAAENYARHRELNFSSVNSQRRPDEEDYIERDSRGTVLHSGVVVNKLRQAGVKLICGPAHFLNEVSLYVEDGTQENGYKYVGWLPVGPVQEFSEYSYNDRLVPTGETIHGYRGVLKNLILNNYLTEDKCNKHFGYCTEKIWARAMWDYRNPGKPWQVLG